MVVPSVDIEIMSDQPPTAAPRPSLVTTHTTGTVGAWGLGGANVTLLLKAATKTGARSGGTTSYDTVTGADEVIVLVVSAS